MSAASPGSQRLRHLWSRLAGALWGAGIADAEIEAEALLRHTLGFGRAEFFATLNESVSLVQAERAKRLVEKRVGGEPLAYLTGVREFHGLDFLVDDRVLIPRQETELLVDLALGTCADRERERVVIADVGTGSGSIAVALATQVSDAVVYATDVSVEALDVASANAERHGVAERVRLLHGDLLSPLPEQADVIVSNPPYIATGELAELPRDVRREPSLALDGGPDGTEVIARLLEQAQTWLKPDGSLFVEIAPEQRDAVMRMAHDCFPSAAIEAVEDAAGRDRALSVRAA